MKEEIVMVAIIYLIIRVVIVNTSLVWPNGLAIDRPAGRLYWNDGKMKCIESSNLDGTGRKQILTEVPHPYGLVVVGTHIYWTDWQTEALHRADKDTGAEMVIIRDRLQGLMTIR
jgi:low-density lipoprotein receptor-related protein 4